MKIKEIRQEGIYYIDQWDKESFLEFRRCNENWLNYRIRREKLNPNQILILREKDTTVGQRYIENNTSSIEFFTKPFTKFEFKSSNEIGEFDRLIISIFKYGWKTIDWS